jgi:hypothetical protein
VIHLFVKIARNADEAANFVFVQLIEQVPSIYDKSHPDHTRWDTVNLAWEKISREMKESGMCVYVHILVYYNQNL